MIPVLFEIGPLKVHSFGAMVLVAFFVGAWLVTKELKRRELKPDHLEGYPMFALIGGIVGARLYWVIEHFGRVLDDPWHGLFGGAGLTWYGGLIGGAAATLWLARRHGQSLWRLCDAFAPGLAAAYGVGRIGCQLSGDGDYGPPSDLPWAMGYPNGVVPTDPGVTVHPTPIYEILMMIPVVLILWKLRTRPSRPGWLFGWYLVLVGLERWISEFFRVRGPEDMVLAMSQAQWISIAAMLFGAWLIANRRAAGGDAAPANA